MASEETALLLDPDNEDEVWIRNKILHHMTRYRNNDHLWITNKEHLLTSKLIINTFYSIEKWSKLIVNTFYSIEKWSSSLRPRILVELRLLWRRSRFQRSLSSQYSRPFLGLVSNYSYLQAYSYLYNCSYLYLQFKLYLTLDNHSWFYKADSKIFLSITSKCLSSGLSLWHFLWNRADKYKDQNWL